MRKSYKAVPPFLNLTRTMKNLLKYTSLFLLLIGPVCVVLVSCEKANDSSEDISATRGKYNGHDWVNLGLSVKWSSCNVGATYPYEYGNYYAWGEVTGYDEGKKEFSKSTYKWYEEGVNALKNNVSYFKIIKMNALVSIGRMKYIPEAEFDEKIQALYHEIDNEYDELMKGEQF